MLYVYRNIQPTVSSAELSTDKMFDERSPSPIYPETDGLLTMSTGGVGFLIQTTVIVEMSLDSPVS